MHIEISKGLDIPIAGAPEASISSASTVESVALLGADYAGLKPRMLVEAGQHVQLGDPLFIDKRDPAVQFTAPGRGTISAINRGARRALQSVVIELDEAEESPATLPTYPGLANTDPDSVSAEDVRLTLFTSGLWTAFRTRPFNKIPQSDSSPHSIFVTAMDTRPLAGDPLLIIDKHIPAFNCGMKILARLTDGDIYLCTAADWPHPVDNERIKHVTFGGPHPSGLPGTHIHHLQPAATNSVVWHIGYQDVVAIGKLFTTGTIWVNRTIALGGTGFKKPRLLRTRIGASIEQLVTQELRDDDDRQRLISGSVLSGRTAAGAEAYLGRYHLQIGAINNTAERQLFGWMNLFSWFGDKYSFAGRFARRKNQQRRYPMSTAQHGRPTAMVPIDAFERVIPLDILPVPLLRALLIGDTDQAQALGCLELAPEDLALCSFVCPGKNDYGTALQLNLEQIEREG